MSLGHPFLQGKYLASPLGHRFRRPPGLLFCSSSGGRLRRVRPLCLPLPSRLGGGRGVGGRKFFGHMLSSTSFLARILLRGYEILVLSEERQSLPPLPRPPWTKIPSWLTISLPCFVGVWVTNSLSLLVPKTLHDEGINSEGTTW